MDPKELRGLYEAYSEVYAPQEEIEEGLRSAVQRLLGGKKQEPEVSKPESRGAELRRKYKVGPEKSDTSAKRQILDRSRAKAERDEREYGGSKYSKSVAQKSKAAHDRYLKAGYSKYGADDARGSGNKARKRAAALNREEFDWIVNTLLDEGYDLSSYTAEEFYDICLDEASYSAKAARAGKDIGKPGKAFAKIAKEAGKRYGSKERGEKVAGAVLAKLRKQHEEVEIFDVVLEFLQAEGYAETLEEAEWLMANVIDEEAIEIILGEEQLNELSVNKMHSYINKAEKDRDRLNKKWDQGTATPKERKKVFDREEGEARASKKIRQKTGKDFFRLNALDKLKSAITKEEYMDEAQEARNNPEKYEREQSKKTAPVRGERTPMPPRGDKRREDFEKWYAANVR